MTKTLRAALALCLVSLLAFVASGCGSSSGSGTDTATLAPPASFIYFEATIDPSGDQESAMRSILADLPGTGAPENRLHDLIQKASKQSGGELDYEKDMKPWLGEVASVFVAGSASKPAAAAVVATKDSDAAQEFVKKAAESAEGEKPQVRSYRDTEYRISDDTAAAVVEDFLVLGNEPGVKAAIDAAEGESLSESDRYKKATDDVSDDRVALIYEDLSGIVRLVSGAAGEQLGPVAPLLGQLFSGEPLVATVRAEQQALVVDGRLTPASSLLNFFGSSTPLIGEVPEDAWLSIGQADMGAQIKKMIGLFAGLLGGEQQLYEQVRRQTGIDLDRDVLSWMGDMALFVHGDSKETIGGGALIQSTDPQASEQALGKLVGAIKRNDPATRVGAARIPGATGYTLQDASMPKPIFLVQAGDKVALAYGEEAARSAVAGGAKLSSASEFTRASGALGGAYTPSLYVGVPSILRLAESFGAGKSEDYDAARPYLTILDYVIAGSTKGDEKVGSRTRIGFKRHE